ncbi:MAG: peptide-methionine (R)-S-oxide reductase MsrB [Hyphomicrobiales bacterium]|nr:peptide-methionine (R)-S-oxide reductase MsrB [Hyphomicrobiales bacterium]
MPTRRQFTQGFAAVLAATAVSLPRTGGSAPVANKFEIDLPADEWKKRLNKEQYAVLREHGTERAGTSPLDKENRAGVFACAGCDLPVFKSDTKYDSGTGWPSFWAPIDNAIGTSEDKSWFATRTEVHCRRCGGHLGHVFDDGPKPTGLRYCMNGVAMKFSPADVKPS